MKADTCCCYCKSKHMTKGALKNHLHAYINWAGLTAHGEVGIFSREISQLSKMWPSLILRSTLVQWAAAAEQKYDEGGGGGGGGRPPPPPPPRLPSPTSLS